MVLLWIHACSSASHASKVSVIDSTHNMAVVQKQVRTSTLMHLTFSSDVQLKQEATHSLLANILNAVPMPASASASTRRSYSAGRRVPYLYENENIGQ